MAAVLAVRGMKRKRSVARECNGPFDRGAGDGLLSRGLSTGVPSALSGLTTVFGMGTGVAPTLESPANISPGRRSGWANETVGRSWCESPTLIWRALPGQDFYEKLSYSPAKGSS